MKTNRQVTIWLLIGGPLLGLAYAILLPFIGLITFILHGGHRARRYLTATARKVFYPIANA